MCIFCGALCIACLPPCHHQDFVAGRAFSVFIYLNFQNKQHYLSDLTSDRSAQCGSTKSSNLESGVKAVGFHSSSDSLKVRVPSSFSIWGFQSRRPSSACSPSPSSSISYASYPHVTGPPTGAYIPPMTIPARASPPMERSPSLREPQSSFRSALSAFYGGVSIPFRRSYASFPVTSSIPAILRPIWENTTATTMRCAIDMPHPLPTKYSPNLARHFVHHDSTTSFATYITPNSCNTYHVPRRKSFLSTLLTYL